MGKRGMGILLAAGVGLFASRTNAQTAADTEDSMHKKYRVVYDVPAGCPPKPEFVRQIVRRAGSRWQAAPQDDSGTVAAEVSQVNGQFEASLVCISQKGTVSRRTLEQTNCEQTVLDMAVMAVACIQSDTDPPPLAVDIGATVGVNWTTGSNAMSVASLFGLHWPGSQFSLMMMAEYSDTGATRANDASGVPLRFRLPALRVDACVLEPAVSETLSFPLCAEVALGYLFVRIDDPAGAWQQRPWATLGVAPQMRVSFRPVFLQVGPSLGLFLGKRSIHGSLANEGMTNATRWQHEIPITNFGLLFRVGVTF